MDWEIEEAARRYASFSGPHPKDRLMVRMLVEEVDRLRAKVKELWQVLWHLRHECEEPGVCGAVKLELERFK